MSRFLSGFVRRLQVLRFLSNEALETSGEKSLSNILQKKFPEAEDIQVKDISGGCGAMYEVYVQSTAFKNLSRLQQHRLVNEVSDPIGYFAGFSSVHWFPYGKMTAVVEREAIS
ncbi:bolA-like protein 3 isoform X1 [Haemaphysalis longicornis]